MPPLSANAEPCREVTCRCLALLCALGAVGAQCGQAALTEQVGARFLEEAGGKREGHRRREERGLRGGPLLEGGGRGRWLRRGGRAGVVPLCVWLGRSLGFVPTPWGRGCRGEGARPAGQAPGVSPRLPLRRQ